MHLEIKKGNNASILEGGTRYHAVPKDQLPYREALNVINSLVVADIVDPIKLLEAPIELDLGSTCLRLSYDEDRRSFVAEQYFPRSNVSKDEVIIGRSRLGLNDYLLFDTSMVEGRGYIGVFVQPGPKPKTES